MTDKQITQIARKLVKTSIQYHKKGKLGKKDMLTFLISDTPSADKEPALHFVLNQGEKPSFRITDKSFRCPQALLRNLYSTLYPSFVTLNR